MKKTTTTTMAETNSLMVHELLQGPVNQQISYGSLDKEYFQSESEWAEICSEAIPSFDYIVIGSGFCSLAVIQRILAKRPRSKILILEGGCFVLAEHFQNMPQVYQSTLGDMSKSYRWTQTSSEKDKSSSSLPSVGLHHEGAHTSHPVQLSYGVKPCFGGRSLVWNAWCPRPTPEEMNGWPTALVKAAQDHFSSAEELLCVVPADMIDADRSTDVLQFISNERPIFGDLQRCIQKLLAENRSRIEGVTRCGPAPMAIHSCKERGKVFSKFSTPAKILEIRAHQKMLNSRGKGSELKIVSQCVVERLECSGNHVNAIMTSRGRLRVGSSTKVILAMGTAPTTELMLQSFPQINNNVDVRRVGGHFMTSVVARIPREVFPFSNNLMELEMAYIYLAGKNAETDKQYHVQLSILSDRDPAKNSQLASRYMPYIMAAENTPQLSDSKDHIVFVSKVLGELDVNNRVNEMRLRDVASVNSTIVLDIQPNATDESTWNSMLEATFQMTEKALSPDPSLVEYWHGQAEQGVWRKERPPTIPAECRVKGVVHDSSTLWMGGEDEGVVGLDYRPRGLENVFITGGSLFPGSGSWNPTLTMVALSQDLADRLIADGQLADRLLADRLLADRLLADRLLAVADQDSKVTNHPEYDSLPIPSDCHTISTLEVLVIEAPLTPLSTSRSLG